MNPVDLALLRLPGSPTDLRPTEELTATAPDGYPVHGWVVRPTGPGPHPVLLMVPGGAARVAHNHRVAGSGVHLCLVEQRRAVGTDPEPGTVADRWLCSAC